MSLFIDSKYLNLISVQLRNFKKRGDLLWNFSCPLCGDSTKDTKKARGYMYRHAAGLMFKCHNCGEAVTFSTFLKRIDPALYTNYLSECILSGDTRFGAPKRASPDAPDERTRSQKREEERDSRFAAAEFPGALRVDRLSPENPCRRYVESRKIPQHQWSRLYYTDDFKRLAARFTDKYDKVLPDNDERLVMPFYNEHGDLTHFQGRRLENIEKDKLRYMTITVVEESKKFFGLERMRRDAVVYVTEGPIDSLFVPNGIATADSHLTSVRELELPNVVLVFDNEPRNKELCREINRAADNGFKVVLWSEKNPCKDINEMVLTGRTIESIMEEITARTYAGLELKMKLVTWRKVDEQPNGKKPRPRNG